MAIDTNTFDPGFTVSVNLMITVQLLSKTVNQSGVTPLPLIVTVRSLILVVHQNHPPGKLVIKIEVSPPVSMFSVVYAKLYEPVAPGKSVVPE